MFFMFQLLLFERDDSRTAEFRDRPNPGKMGAILRALPPEGEVTELVGLARCMLHHIPLDAGGAVSLQRAVLHGAAGELDEAFVHLDRALDLHDPGLGYLAVAPQWDSLRDDPRFAERLKRMALRPV